MADKKTKIPMMAASLPMVGEAGQTGTWRDQCPVIESTRCLTCRDKPRDCQLCWLYCPDACVRRGKPPTIDYQYCKGCGICVKVCPSKAIEMTAEEQE